MGAIAVTESYVRQIFVVYEEQARVKEAHTDSRTISTDGSISKQRSDIIYEFTDRGTILGANGNVTSPSVDGNGFTTKSTITQSFAVVNDQARLASDRGAVG